VPVGAPEPIFAPPGVRHDRHARRRSPARAAWRIHLGGRRPRDASSLALAEYRHPAGTIVPQRHSITPASRRTGRINTCYAAADSAARRRIQCSFFTPPLRPP